jgi:hypothetical protein
MDYSAEIGASVLHADHPGIDGLMPISIKHDFILSGRRSCAFREIRHSTQAPCLLVLVDERRLLSL